jgi:predicted ATPase
MIKSVKLTNFRCLEEARIDLSKITLLTGANSSGKSTFIYSILGSLQATDFPYSFAPNGEYINLGDYQDIISKHNTDLNFSIEFIVTKKGYSDVSMSTTWTNDKKTGMPTLASFEVSCLEFTSHLTKSDEGWVFDLTVLKSEKNSVRQQKQFQELTEYLFATLRREFGKEPPNEKSDEAYQIGTKIEIRARTVKNIQPMLVSRYGANYDVFSAIRVIESCFTDLEDNFAYISPFRLHPERTYYQRSGTPRRVDKFGDGYVDLILKWQSEDKKKFATFKALLKGLMLADSVKVQIFAGGRFQISVKTPKNKSYVNLADTGFGISQFLPVLVADLQLQARSLLILSQPEIHLHPSVQAEFADYLNAGVKVGEKRYLVETHSEYLINRIRLLIVKGELSSEDVNVYHFEKTADQTRLHRLAFNKDGTISNAPKDFFDTYMLDTLKIALES